MSTIDKGTRWTAKVEEFLSGLGFVTSRRAWFDKGDDLAATAGGGVELSIEAKDHRTLALAGWVDQADKNAPDEAVGVVFAHRLGKAKVEDCYVVMSGSSFAALLVMLNGGALGSSHRPTEPEMTAEYLGIEELE